MLTYYHHETLGCKRSLMRKPRKAGEIPLSREEHERFFLEMYDLRINGVKEAWYRYEV